MRALFESFSPTKSRASTATSLSIWTEEDPHTAPATAAPSSSSGQFVAVAPGSGISAALLSPTPHTPSPYTSPHNDTSQPPRPTTPSSDAYASLYECEEENEAMELGISHNLLPDELYLPCHPSRDWIRCYVSTTGPNTFRMYLEGKKKVRFLLSARQFTSNGAFYISTDEDFPYHEQLPHYGYIARLDRCVRDKSFLLSLTHCHLCDYKLGLFDCGRGPREREVLAKISHSFREQRPWGLQCRTVSVTLPSLSLCGARRKIWCPRSFRNALGADAVAADVDFLAALALDRERESCLSLASQAPQWNDELGSLVVKFHGNRILAASAKNFLLCIPVKEIERQRERERERTRTSSTGSAPQIIYETEEETLARAREREERHSRRFPLRQRLHSHTTVSLGSSADGARSFATVHTIHRSRTQSVVHNGVGDGVAALPPPPSLSHNGGSSERVLRRKRGESDLEFSERSRAQTAADLSFTPLARPHKTLAAVAQSAPTSTAASPKTAPPEGLKKSVSASAETMRTNPFVNAEPQPVMQFGKCSLSRFVLDFKYPLSPLQAFGVALASFAHDARDSRSHAELDHFDEMSTEMDDAQGEYSDLR